MRFSRPRRPRRPAAAAAAAVRATTLLLLATLALGAAACNGDKATGGSGPVTLKFTTPVFAKTASSARDTVLALVSIDGAAPITAPRDSVLSLTRGEHTFDIRYNIDYLPQHFTLKVNPSGGTQTLKLLPEGSCRDYAVTGDQPFCVEGGLAKNVLLWSQHRRVYCAVSDFGDFCSRMPSDLGSVSGLGAVWPADQAADQYVSEGKLLIAATLGPEVVGAGGSRLAMSLYEPGDYAPHVRLRPVSGDSSRYLNEVWTDARHLPIYPDVVGRLADTDRRGQNFGLAVRITYSIPANQPDAVFARFDVRNVSATDSFRFVHPEEPAGGHTLQNVFLVPVVDANVGVNGNQQVAGQAEVTDDNATVFPQDSLIAAYDQTFNVSNFSPGAQTRPALVGLRLVQGPPGTTARALLLTSDNALSYASFSAEQATYQYLTGARSGGVPAGCAVSAGGEALVCSSESASDVRVGWSVGPVASLAPGQSTSITVALIFASPKVGSFTSGTAVAPQNNDLANTARAIYTIAETLRTLGAQVKGTVVTPAP